MKYRDELPKNVEKLALKIGHTITQLSEIEGTLCSGRGIKAYVRLKPNRLRVLKVAAQLKKGRKIINDALCYMTQAEDLKVKQLELFEGK